jgi:hypothetical protein
MVELKKVPTPGLFKGHTMPIFAMQIFENFLFSCSQDTTVRKFDISVSKYLTFYGTLNVHGHI